jgi:hypothetical protein
MRAKRKNPISPKPPKRPLAVVKDVAALTALLRGVTIAGCVPGTTQKRKKKLPRFSPFFQRPVVSGKRLKETLSKKLPNSESAWR